VTILFFIVLGILAASVVTAALLSASPQALAGFIRMTGPVVTILAGVALTAVGRAGLGLPLVAVGVGWWSRMRSVGRLSSPSGSSRRSTVRTALLEMELDHESGELDGVVLTGTFEGRRLSDLDRSQLLGLLRFAGTDGESAQLLEAYLDRAVPGWREDPQADAHTRHGSAPQSGAMTKEEAYQVLGLHPGAGAQQIREAHRRLMKRIHPDSGGSTFLAAKINQAKDVLLD
jgi:hypothetical protein